MRGLCCYNNVCILWLHLVTVFCLLGFLDLGVRKVFPVLRTWDRYGLFPECCFWRALCGAWVCLITGNNKPPCGSKVLGSLPVSSSWAWLKTSQKSSVAPAMFSPVSHPHAPHTTQVGYQRCPPELLSQGCSLPNKKQVGAGSTGLVMQWLNGKPSTNMGWRQCLHFSDWIFQSVMKKDLSSASLWGFVFQIMVVHS